MTGANLPQAIGFDPAPPSTVSVGRSFSVGARATTGLDVTITATGTYTGSGTNTIAVTPTAAGALHHRRRAIRQHRLRRRAAGARHDDRVRRASGTGTVDLVARHGGARSAAGHAVGWGPQPGYAGDKPKVGQTVVLHVGGVGAVPADASAVVLNVTGTDALAAGFVTVWPCGEARPLASSLNLVPGATSPNAVITRLGTNGDVCLYTQSGTHLIADVTGYLGT